MKTSVERTIVVRGTFILVASLAVIGLGTGTSLVVSARRSLDDVLTAAAHAQAHPETPKWEVEHSETRVETWIARRQDARVPDAALEQVLRGERPLFLDVDDRRMVLLPAEQEIGDREAHIVVVAAAPAVRPLRVLTPFLLAYAGFSTVVALTAWQILARSVRRAFVPLDRARHEAEVVLTLGQGSRLTEDAPLEVHRLLVSFNALLDRLDQAWSVQSRFTSEAAHELRTPVATLIGELDVALRRERDAESYRSTLISAREEAGRLHRIIEALSALSRLDAGEAEGLRQITRASEIAERALQAEQAEIVARGGTVELIVGSDTELVANVPLLELALQNLLRNAGRHAPGARVEVRLAVDGPDVVWEVHDAGSGVPKDEQEAVFTRFVRGSRARVQDAHGLGLGLAFAREVARRHGGDCTLESSPLGGTLARLRVCVSSNVDPKKP